MPAFNELRLIETSAALAKLFQASLPDEVNALGEPNQSPVQMLVQRRVLDELARLVHAHTGRCGGFIDVTDESVSTLARARAALKRKAPASFPDLAARREDVVRALDQIESANIEAFVRAYSGNFSTRHASSAEGEQAPKWLAAQWKKMADDAGRTDIRVELVDPPRGYRQNSVRITIPGRDVMLPAVVLGGHLDSINHKDGSLAPGVDDDGSGISALTEIYRVMLAGGFRPKAEVRIFGYAAEELGLFGSRAIAERYSRENAKVRAVFQLDMVAYPGQSRTLTFIDDHVNTELTTWTEQLYGLYVGGPVRHDSCGYACSDHASWDRYGFPAVFPFEASDSEMNPRLHSTKDLWDEYLDAEFAARFAKLGYAFAAVLADE
ncbi:MAG: M20/M25/M40 family metallo-hydrolase [Deltaproteobacteria bacterium]|nr:M20/M25/M40 family metallo-hydrolase [Deltaproteobacteria bacterium]